MLAGLSTRRYRLLSTHHGAAHADQVVEHPEDTERERDRGDVAEHAGDIDEAVPVRPDRRARERAGHARADQHRAQRREDRDDRQATEVVPARHRDQGGEQADDAGTADQYEFVGESPLPPTHEQRQAGRRDQRDGEPATGRGQHHEGNRECQRGPGDDHGQQPPRPDQQFGYGLRHRRLALRRPPGPGGDGGGEQLRRAEEGQRRDDHGGAGLYRVRAHHDEYRGHQRGHAQLGGQGDDHGFGQGRQHHEPGHVRPADRADPRVPDAVQRACHQRTRDCQARYGGQREQQPQDRGYRRLPLAQRPAASHRG